jgi:hypothetical protein
VLGGPSSGFDVFVIVGLEALGGFALTLWTTLMTTLRVDFGGLRS